MIKDPTATRRKRGHRESSERGEQVVLIIDEAHRLDAESLEGVRCLSNDLVLPPQQAISGSSACGEDWTAPGLDDTCPRNRGHSRPPMLRGCRFRQSGRACLPSGFA